jgi:hypothetical protein
LAAFQFEEQALTSNVFEQAVLAQEKNHELAELVIGALV